MSTMNTDHVAPKTIDEYIAGFPHDVQVVLQKIRLMIKQVRREGCDGFADSSCL